MNYEVLKRLKDSGFPLQPVLVEFGKELTLLRRAVVFSRAPGVDPAVYYVPSLSDLIEACGQYLKNMSRVADGWECNQGGPGRGEASRAKAETHGPTLDDALAELWLMHAAAAA